MKNLPQYEFEFIPAEDSEIDAFLSLVNIILLVFTEMNMTGKGRKREHRLGLANTKLQEMHISQNLLKEMVNVYLTICAVLLIGIMLEMLI